MKTLQSDLIYAVRLMYKNPGYAVTTILLLALGIGANTALFNVADSILLRPLPYGHPERLVVTLHNGDAPVSPADYFDYRQSAKSFEAMAAAQAWGGTLAGEQPEQVPGVQFSAKMLKVLDVKPMLGRAFRAEEEHGGAARVVLLSYRLWQQRFAGNKEVVGQTITIDRIPYTVIGVMPAHFRFAPFWATRAQMWAPLDLDKRLNDRDGRSLRIFARLRKGVPIATAQAEMSAIAKRLATSYPATNAKLDISVVPLHEKVVRSVRPTLLALMGTVGFVLLIACATVSNLLLARAVSRRAEFALRAALGAARGDLLRMAAAEVLVLAVAGGVAGVLLSRWAVQALSLMLPENSIPRLTETNFDGTAVLFAAAISLLTALLAGVSPAMQAARAGLNEDLRNGGRGNSGGSGRALRSSLIAVEVALALVLMAGAGLMMRTMLALQSVDAGFVPAHLITMQVAVNGTAYDQNGRRSSLFREVRERLAKVPGIESVSAINHLPLGGDLWGLRYSIAGRAAPVAGEGLGAVYRVIMPEYFRTMQLRTVRGRAFNDSDDERGAPVAIINESMARRRWPGENPLGKAIRFGTGPQEAAVLKKIIGVVKDARQSDWTSAPNDEIYLPYYQRPDAMGMSYLTFVMRVQGDSNSMIEAARQQVRSFERSLSISEATSMDRIIADELWRQRLATMLMATFAGLSIFLAAVGVYGVISHSMRERTREIGIRMALGAQSGSVVALALREGMLPVLYGGAAGLFFAALLTRFLRSLLYGVTAVDVPTFSMVAAGVLLVCFGANLIPAFRAARMDPVSALRTD